MADTYPNYAALAAAQVLGVDYQILSRTPTGSRLAHVAIHGGNIEPGTTELAQYLAGADHLFYAFDGMKSGDNTPLFINSINFDEPTGLALIAKADYAVSWHCSVDAVTAMTYISGLDTVLASKIVDRLTAAGFSAMVGGTPAETDGDSTTSFVNKTNRHAGVKLEITTAQMQDFFLNGDLSRPGRNASNRTDAFLRYAEAVAAALKGLDVPNTAPGTSSVVGVGRTATASSQLPGDYGIPTLAPLYVSGMPLAAVSEAIRLASQPVSSLSYEQFWSTAPRPNGDPLREVFEWSLSVSRLTNRLRFSLAHFPQRVWPQYQDADGVWRPLTQPGGTPVQLTISDSVPAVVPPGLTGILRAHPQHFGAGHWMAHDIDVEPVTASRFRLIMTRLPSGAAPRSSDSRPVSYSLGIKDVSVGYRLTNDGNLPWSPLQDASHTAPISRGRDLLGSQVDYLIRHSRAASVLGDDGAWRSKPQPVPQAVVSMYLDMRLPNGSGQILDRILAEPLTSGPTVNLYYAPTMPDLDWSVDRFKPSNDPLAFPQVRPVNPGVQAGSDGLLLPGVNDGVLVDNQAIQFDPYSPFLISGIVQPQLTSDAPDTLTVLDNGVFSLTLSRGVFTARLGPAIVGSDMVVHGFNASLPWAVAYDGQQLTLRTPWSRRSQSYIVPRVDSVPGVLMLGQPVDLSGGGRIRMTSLVLAQGRASDIETIDAHWGAPSAYVLPRGGSENPQSSTSANALLRLDGSLVTAGSDSVCPLGLIGGPGVDFDRVVWTPINGDFRLMKEAFTFRPVKARLVKLEFSNLAPVTLNLASNPVVKVNLFPNGSSPGLPTVAQAAIQQSGAAPVGPRVAMATTQAFADSPQRRSTSAYADSSHLPTEALFAPDPLDAQRLRRAGQPFRFMPLPGITAPRWRTTGLHRYHVVETVLDTKIAYAVGVSRVRVYRSDPSAQQDNAQYIELFHDASHIEDYELGGPRSWVLTGSGLVAPPVVDGDGVAATSITYVSRSKVLALQFSATQSDAQQLVADSEMDDPSLRHWKPIGDASLSSTDAYATDIGQMVRVRRGHADASWDAMEAAFATWDAIESSNPDPWRPTWAELEQSSSEATLGGIESVSGVTPPPRGHLHAAARVFTDKPLDTPLILQLVNGDGRILAEQTAMTQNSQVTEWIASYELGSGITTGIRTWDQIATLGAGGGVPTWDEMEALGMWSEVAQDMGQIDVRNVKVRLFQQGASGTGEWLVDSLAIFADPLVWEVSRDGGRNWFKALDIRSDARGVLVFPDLPVDDLTGGTQLRWRVTTFAPGTSVSSVVVRPWYVSLSGAVPHLDGLQAAGASTSVGDHYARIDQDPFFQLWSSPIPEWWWLVSKKWRDLFMPTASGPQQPVLPGTVVEGSDEGAPPAPPQDSLVTAMVYPIH